MTPEEEKRRLAWQCRRGMLELDELLLGFLERGYDHLGPQEKLLWQQLLQEADTRLFTWIIEHPEQAPRAYRELVESIRACQGMVVPRGTREST